MIHTVEYLASCKVKTLQSHKSLVLNARENRPGLSQEPSWTTKPPVLFIVPPLNQGLHPQLGSDWDPLGLWQPLLHRSICLRGPPWGQASPWGICLWSITMSWMCKEDKGQWKKWNYLPVVSFIHGDSHSKPMLGVGIRYFLGCAMWLYVTVYYIVYFDRFLETPMVRINKRWWGGILNDISNPSSHLHRKTFCHWLLDSPRVGPSSAPLLIPTSVCQPEVRQHMHQDNMGLSVPTCIGHFQLWKTSSILALSHLKGFGLVKICNDLEVSTCAWGQFWKLPNLKPRWSKWYRGVPKHCINLSLLHNTPRLSSKTSGSQKIRMKLDTRKNIR